MLQWEDYLVNSSKQISAAVLSLMDHIRALDSFETPIGANGDTAPALKWEESSEGSKRKEIIDPRKAAHAGIESKPSFVLNVLNFKRKNTAFISDFVQINFPNSL